MAAASAWRKEVRIRGFVVATKCQTTEEFVERYHMRTEDRSIFVGIVEERVVGSECAFAILLADKTPVFAGICTVLEVHRDSDNPFQRRGMRLGISRLGVTSEPVFAQMAAARAATKRRFARGSSMPPVIASSILEGDDEISDSIPIDLEEVVTSPPPFR
jgi:hypothetical protein